MAFVIPSGLSDQAVPGDEQATKARPPYHPARYASKRTRKAFESAVMACPQCCPPDQLNKAAPVPRHLYSGNRVLQAAAIAKLVSRGEGRGAALATARDVVNKSAGGDPDDDSDPGFKAFLRKCAASGDRAAAAHLAGLS